MIIMKKDENDDGYSAIFILYRIYKFVKKEMQFVKNECVNSTPSN